MHAYALLGTRLDCVTRAGVPVADRAAAGLLSHSARARLPSAPNRPSGVRYIYASPSIPKHLVWSERGLSVSLRSCRGCRVSRISAALPCSKEMCLTRLSQFADNDTMDQYQLDSLLKQLQGFENAGDSKATLEDVGSSTVPESALEPGEVEDADQHDIGSETIEHTGSEHARIREPKPEDPGGEKAEQTSAATSMDASALERLLATLVPLSAPSEPSSYEPSDPSSYHDPIPYHAPPYIDEHPPETSDAPNPPPDLRSYTFAQALPVIGRLSEDPAFIDKLQEVRSVLRSYVSNGWNATII